MEKIKLWLDIAADIFAIIASGIAIYLFFFKKDKINSALNFILNYSNQLSLSELKYRIERLNDYNVNDVTQKKEVFNILHEIHGQINGSTFLKERLKDQMIKLTSLIENVKNLSEPKKRSLVSELRESIRNLNVENYDNLTK